MRHHLMQSPEIFCGNISWGKYANLTKATFVLYGCKMWSLAYREEHKLQVFVNKMLRRGSG